VKVQAAHALFLVAHVTGKKLAQIRFGGPSAKVLDLGEHIRSNRAIDVEQNGSQHSKMEEGFGVKGAANPSISRAQTFAGFPIAVAIEIAVTLAQQFLGQGK